MVDRARCCGLPRRGLNLMLNSEDNRLQSDFDQNKRNELSTNASIQLVIEQPVVWLDRRGC